MQRTLAFAVIASFLLLTHPASSQQPPEGETKVVLRVARDFIHELTGKRFHRDEPVRTSGLGGVVNGRAQVDGRFDVRLEKSDNGSSFDLLATGEVRTQLVVTSRPVHVHGHGVASFTGKRRFVFDGKGFSGQAVDVKVNYRSTVDQIDSFRGGLIGAITRRAARPTVMRKLPESDREASAIIRTRLAEVMANESDQLMATMNKIRPIIAKGEQMLREEKMLSPESMQQKLAATDQHLYMSIGPAGHQIPQLPRLEPAKAGPIELWISVNKTKTESLLEILPANWRLARPYVLQRIASHAPEYAEFCNHLQVEAVEGWYVLTFNTSL